MNGPLDPKGRARALGGLCVTELVSWGVLYYSVPATLPSLVEQTGWSTTQIMTGFTVGLLLVVTAPIHLVALDLPWRRAPAVARSGEAGHIRRVASSGAFRMLALGFAVAGLGLYAATTNLVPLLVNRGIDPMTAAIVLGLCGAGQLLGRVGFPTLTRRTTPYIRDAAILATGALSVALLALSPGALLPATVVAVFAGAARGAFTLVQATAVADRWGTRDFGTINALATAPAAIAIALAPAAGAALAEWTGGYTAAWLLLGGLVALGALLVTRTRPSRPTAGELDEA